MSEERAPYGKPATWKDRLIAEAEAAIRNPHRETMIVLVYRDGVWRVIPTMPPACKIAVSDS